MVKRQNPKRVTLPNGRTFYARYKQVFRADLPANLRLERPYRQRAAPRRRRSVRQGGRGFKNAFKKVFNSAKIASKNKAVRNIGRDSGIAKTVVDLATGYALNKLQSFF